MIFYFDLETTGLNQFHDKITEFCFLPEDDSLGKYVQLVNPEKKISTFITKLTGISPEMVQDQPNFQTLAPKIMEYLKPCRYLVAHNSDGFDKIVLQVHLAKSGITREKFTWKYIDTLLLAKKLYPYLFKHNLKSLMESLGLTVQTAHRAEADTLMLQELYRHMCGTLAKKLIKNVSEVLENPDVVYDYLYDY